MFKRCKVVMLPTEKATWPNCIWLGRISGQLNFDHSHDNFPCSINSIDNSMLPQHLYILSDDEIEKNDWYFNQIVRRDIENNIYPEGVVPIKCTNESDTCNELKCIKIIATTDCSLSIPLIPQSFINKYVNEYNKGNKIEKCMVEYQMYNRSIPFTYNSDPDSSYVHYELKLNPNNTINIKFIRDNWTKEELNESAMCFYNKYHGILNQSDIQSIAKFIDELI